MKARTICLLLIQAAWISCSTNERQQEIRRLCNPPATAYSEMFGVGIWLERNLEQADTRELVRAWGAGELTPMAAVAKMEAEAGEVGLVKCPLAEEIRRRTPDLAIQRDAPDGSGDYLKFQRSRPEPAHSCREETLEPRLR